MEGDVSLAFIPFVMLKTRKIKRFHHDATVAKLLWAVGEV